MIHLRSNYTVLSIIYKRVEFRFLTFFEKFQLTGQRQQLNQMLMECVFMQSFSRQIISFLGPFWNRKVVTTLKIPFKISEKLKNIL